MRIQEISYDTPGEIRKPKKKRKNLKRLFTWIKLIFITALLITAIISLALSPLFNISKIEVKGSERYKQEDIAATSGVVIGSNGFKTIGSNIRNLFTFRCGKAEENILKHYPYVKSVIARFIVTGKMKISITERKPIAVIPFMGANLIIDNEAYVLENIGKKIDKSLPIVKGLKFKQYELGQAIRFENPEAFQDVLKLMDDIIASDKKQKPDMYKLINWFDVTDRGNISVLLDSRLKINLGNLDQIEYRLEFCKKIIFEKLKKRDKGFLDMTTENPSFAPEE